jgi:hypothetical protein
MIQVFSVAYVTKPFRDMAITLSLLIMMMMQNVVMTAMVCM